MTKLTIDSFLFSTDLELSQYRILSCLNNYRRDFQTHNIFPGLIELTELSRTLNKIIKKRSLLLNYFSIPVLKVDEDKRVVFFENFYMNNDDIERIFDLMKWAFPEINKVIEDGLHIKSSNVAGNPSLIPI